MNFWSRFDKVFTLGFTGLPLRANLMDGEFGRVGLRAERIWQFPTPYDHVIQAHVRCRAGMQSIPYFNSGMGHYRAVKTALELGARSVLVVEDDIRFLADVEELGRVVTAMPADWGVCLFDVLKADKDDISVVQASVAADRVNEFWNRSWGNPRSFGCYAMTRPAMEWFVSRVEAPCRVTGFPLINVDLNLRADRLAPNINVYYARPNAAIQVCVGDGNFNSAHGNLNKYYDFYKAIGVDIAKYGDPAIWGAPQT